MANTNQSNHLNRARGSSALLAIGLAASLAALGCSTNLNPGAGTPTRMGPEMRSTPTSGEPIGTENTPPLPPPMTSSYTRQEVIPSVSAQPRSLHHTPDEAAAIMAGHAPLRGRYLGVANPAGVAASRGYASDVNIARMQRPPYSVPEQTVNSSIVSPPTGVVSSGAGTVDSTGAAVIGSLTGTPTTTAAATLPAATTVTTATPTPTAAISGNATVTSASAGGTVTTNAAPVATTGTTATQATATANPTVTAASASTPVRIVRSTTGTTTVTNTSGRSQ